jgi:putative transposase
MLATKGMRFPTGVILVCIRWYAAYQLSYRRREEMMEERGVFVDHSWIKRWAIRFLPLLEEVFRKRKYPVGESWRIDETYNKIKGTWKYPYRAMDKEGKTIDFLLTARRANAVAVVGLEDVVEQRGFAAAQKTGEDGDGKAGVSHCVDPRRVQGVSGHQRLWNMRWQLWF